MPRRSKQQPGVVLLLALLLLAAVTASTIGTAITISNTTSQSANLDNFIIASFAGDTGIEQALAIVKSKRNGDTISAAITSINTALGGANLVGAGLRGGFSGTARAASDPVSIPTLLPDQSHTFDILEYNNGVLATTSIRYLDIKGSTTAGALELSWILLDQNGDSTCTGRKFIIADNIRNGISPWLLSGTLNQQGGACTETNPKGFRVKIRALNIPSVDTVDETISNLLIEAYPCDIRTTTTCGAPAGVPGRIQVDVTGTTGSSKAVKTASVLWQLPAAGLFNYILFTEGDIIPN